MKPIRISLRNFITYVYQEFSFDFESAVIVGATGSGKSTILDGITFALWGKARSNAKNLCRYGDSPLEVNFMFDIGGEVYAVERSYTTGSSLQFSRRNEVGEWSSLSGRTNTETQENIDRVLRVSYDTFISSSFLQQGKADRFMLLGPSDRKRVLEDILGLQYYEKWALEARKRCRDAGEGSNSLETQIKLLFEQLTTEDILLEELNSTVEELEENLRENNRELVKFSELYQEIAGSKYSLEDLRFEALDLQRKLEKLKSDGKRLYSSGLCPTCGLGLSDEKKQEILLEFKNEYAVISPRYEKVLADLKGKSDHNDKIEDSLQSIRTSTMTIEDQNCEIRQRIRDYRDRIVQETTLREVNQRLRIRIDDLEFQLSRRKTEYEDLRILSSVLSREGLPSQLLKRAIPELEQSSNEFLQLLTEGQFQIQLRTGTESGRETLEIEVLDGVYNRPYETYSGGQSFRISLAIRLGLSTLLTKTAGSSLRFLAIDEGWGSQDAEGRQLILDCIKRIRSYFPCILAISHIEDIKIAFDTVFQVTRTTMGSWIERI